MNKHKHTSYDIVRCENSHKYVFLLQSFSFFFSYSEKTENTRNNIQFPTIISTFTLSVILIDLLINLINLKQTTCLVSFELRLVWRTVDGTCRVCKRTCSCIRCNSDRERFAFPSLELRRYTRHYSSKARLTELLKNTQRHVDRMRNTSVVLVLHKQGRIKDVLDWKKI